MPNLGNAWHIPGNPPAHEGRHAGPGRRDRPRHCRHDHHRQPVPGGRGEPGQPAPGRKQRVLPTPRRRGVDRGPDAVPAPADNNKYYAGAIPTTGLQSNDVIQYYLRLPYSDHDTTFLRAKGAASAATADEEAARRTPFAFTLESSAIRGAWGPVFALPNVAVHASLLPNGLVLLWGRRDGPDDSLDEHVCTPQLWDPVTGAVTATPQPKLSDGRRRSTSSAPGTRSCPTVGCSSPAATSSTARASTRSASTIRSPRPGHRRR